MTLSLPPENITKPYGFLIFSEKECIGNKWVNCNDFPTQFHQTTFLSKSFSGKEQSISFEPTKDF